MRRPHPRFDARRNAWVTNAGGKLKLLAPGPKNSETESTAWDAFYRHMAGLGQPIQQIGGQSITLGKLADEYGEWMKAEVSASRMKPRTLAYYQFYLQRFLDAVGGKRLAMAILPIELERSKTNWHSVQTVQRLYNWGCEMGLLPLNPLKGVERPRSGGRKRILPPAETARLLRGADRDFRPFLLMLQHTLARPQEIRALQWKQFQPSPTPIFVLREFKAKNLRKDDVDERIIPIDSRLVRLLARLARHQPHDPDDFVLLNRLGKPWTANAVRCRMRRLRGKLGFGPDERGENVVAYTMRHTGGTRATAQGIRDRVLADLMGHAQTTTTRRYQHLQAEHLHAAVQKTNQRRAQ